MNAVEIEEAVSRLAEAPFDPEEFPFAFLEAFGNKSTTIKRLKSGSSNQSDLPGGVLQRNNIHLKVCGEGTVAATLTALRESPATARQKAKFILATDGKDFQAENLVDGETVVCDYPDFHNHFGFFLPLAGITTVRQIRENAFDIKATGRLNRLYIELLKENPDWDTAERRQEMNHFMARLIFCFFAEDTNIFYSEGLFTETVARMSAGDSANTHEVLAEIFRAMSTPLHGREAAGIRNWANGFPYVNGGLFAASQDGRVEVPRFSRIARSYLLHVGNLDWTKINPDIFGSMIQAVADDEERGALGMHYTSVPNILKVLNPLFLDDLRAQLEEAGDNPRKLLNLRKRMARIRVFDPACGSGNFLVIAYKEMRAIEAEINRRREEPDLKSEIPLTNFRGIEIRHFSCEIARLALIIAEYQCDVMYRGPKLALAEFLPLKADNWITCGNALRLDWLSICPPTGTGVKLVADDLFSTPLEQPEIDFENEGGETYICGNPPYLGKGKLSTEQKLEMKTIFEHRISKFGYIDYVACWLIKAADYLLEEKGIAAFVTTNSICQGRQAPLLWSELARSGITTCFAHTTFKWANSATHNAAVMCVIIGITNETKSEKFIFTENERRRVSSISAYLTEGEPIYVNTRGETLSSQLGVMQLGNKANDGGFLSFGKEEKISIISKSPHASLLIKRYYGSREFNNSLERYCLWIADKALREAVQIKSILERIENVRLVRIGSPDAGNQKLAEKPHQFREMHCGKQQTLVIPIMTSVRREYLPCGLLDDKSIISGQAFGIYDGEIWQLAILLSKIHFSWIAAICGRLKEDYRYSNDLGWNTFPVPTLTEQNKTDLTCCAEDILLAREHYFPATIADMYDPDRMDSEFPLVRAAHDRNDETLERIYIGRRFKNDTERLEKLFELYTKMTQTAPKKTTKRKLK